MLFGLQICHRNIIRGEVVLDFSNLKALVLCLGVHGSVPVGMKLSSMFFMIACVLFLSYSVVVSVVQVWLVSDVEEVLLHGSPLGAITLCSYTLFLNVSMRDEKDRSTRALPESDTELSRSEVLSSSVSIVTTAIKVLLSNASLTSSGLLSCVVLIVVDVFLACIVSIVEDCVRMEWRMFYFGHYLAAQ